MLWHRFDIAFSIRQSTEYPAKHEDCLGKAGLLYVGTNPNLFKENLRTDYIASCIQKNPERLELPFGQQDIFA